MKKLEVFPLGFLIKQKNTLTTAEVSALWLQYKVIVWQDVYINIFLTLLKTKRFYPVDFLKIAHSIIWR
jgi:hypothetical protein